MSSRGGKQKALSALYISLLVIADNYNHNNAACKTATKSQEHTKMHLFSL